MAQIATTIEQSKKLIELGIDVNTADMTYDAIVVSGEDKMLINGWTLNVGLYSAIKDNDFSYRNGYTFPAWSLSALLGLIKPVNENTYTIQGTLDGGAIISFEEVTSVAFQEDNILDAAFEMVCYLLENKLI